MKIENGITLVALVITVIVLLILATVSINLVVNNGILDKAKYAVNKYREQEELEQIKLAVLSAQMKNNGKLTSQNLNTKLQATFNNDETVTEISDYYFYKANKNYRIYKDGKVEAGHLLPDKYQQVEYIESTGTQYIDTKIKNDMNFGYIESRFQITSTNETRYYIFGCYSERGANRLQFSFSNPYFIGIGNNNSYTNSLVNEKIGTKLVTVKLTTTQCIVDDEVIFTGSGYTTTTNNINILIFGCNNTQGDSAFLAKDTRIYSFYIYNYENELIRNFIPCYSTTTVTDVDGIERPKDTIGLYDTVEGKFYVNQGSGTFEKGNDV